MEALKLKAIAVLDELHASMDERLGRWNSHEQADIFATIGTVIAMLRDGYDPDDNL